MPVLNTNRYLALHERRFGNLIEEHTTVKRIRIEEAFDTGSPSYIMEIEGSPNPHIFPVDSETRKIRNLKKGDKIIIKRCKSKPFKIAGITYESGETILYLKDSIDQYVI